MTTSSSTRKTALIELASRQVTVYEPTEAQWVRLLRVSETISRNSGEPGKPASAEGGRVTVKAVILFDKILASLFAEQSEWDEVEEALATGAISEEFYLGFLKRVAAAFGLELDLEAQKPPAKPTKRAAARRR